MVQTSPAGKQIVDDPEVVNARDGKMPPIEITLSTISPSG
jgi:hypothetical protein